VFFIAVAVYLIGFLVFTLFSSSKPEPWALDDLSTPAVSFRFDKQQQLKQQPELFLLQKRNNN
jgi:hypothetical protein